MYTEKATTYSPILLFTYNRLAHTQRCVEALLKNSLSPESELFIYSDAAKDETQQKAVEEVRQYIHTIQGFKQITITERDENWGLARSIIDGVTTQVNRFGRVIVLEDDLVVAPHFLQFMNDALETYKDEPQVGHIHELKEMRSHDKVVFQDNHSTESVHLGGYTVDDATCQSPILIALGNGDLLESSDGVNVLANLFHGFLLAFVLSCIRIDIQLAFRGK